MGSVGGCQAYEHAGCHFGWKAVILRFLLAGGKGVSLQTF